MALPWKVVGAGGFPSSVVTRPDRGRALLVATRGVLADQL